MFAVFMAFLAPILHSTCNLIDSHLSNNLFRSKSSIIFYNSLTNVIAVPFLLLFGLPHLVSFKLLGILTIIAAIEVFYQLPYYLALRKIDTSITSALFSLANVLIPVLAWLIVDEKLHISQYFGFAVIIIASVILNIDNPRRIRINSAFWLMLMCSVSLAFQSVLYKYALENLDWVTAVFYPLVISSLLSLCFLIPSHSRRRIISGFGGFKKNFKYFLLNEAIYQSGEIPSLFALSTLSVVAIEGINATQPIFVLIFSLLISLIYGKKLKEEIAPKDVVKKLLCFGFIAWGVILILR